MGLIRLTENDPQEIIPPGKAGDEYSLEITGGDARLGHTRDEALSERGRRVRAGDRPLVRLRRNGERVFVNALDENVNVEVDPQGFDVFQQARGFAAKVLTDNDPDETTKPATDGFVWTQDRNVDVNAATEQFDLVAPDRADFIVIHVGNADGAFNVKVRFKDSDGGTTILSRTSSENSNLAGDASTDVFVRMAIASPYIRVRIQDDSAATNELNYTVYAR